MTFPLTSKLNMIIPQQGSVAYILQWAWAILTVKMIQCLSVAREVRGFTVLGRESEIIDYLH